MSTTINTTLPAAAPNTATKAAATTPTTVAPAQGTMALTQQDFLKIMVAQFTKQDPLASGSGGSSNGTSDYVNELMAMTNLTTMQTMSSQQSLQLAGTLPGSTVTLSVNGSAVSGPVSAAQIQNGALYVTINGVQYPASEIISINQTATQATDAASAAAAAAAQAAASN